MIRGAPSKSTLVYLLGTSQGHQAQGVQSQQVDPTVKVDRRVQPLLYQRVSVAIIRATGIAYNVTEYRCWRVPVAVAVAAPVAVPAAGAAV